MTSAFYNTAMIACIHAITLTSLRSCDRDFEDKKVKKRSVAITQYYYLTNLRDQSVEEWRRSWSASNSRYRVLTSSCTLQPPALTARGYEGPCLLYGRACADCSPFFLQLKKLFDILCVAYTPVETDVISMSRVG